MAHPRRAISDEIERHLSTLGSKYGVHFMRETKKERDRRTQKRKIHRKRV